MIHFHAALLDRRGEFDAAIAVLSRLADTEEGRKAAYFKDLSELQQRAGKIPDALATVERWKLAAPGDKTAWITGSRLLRESGKPDEAVKMTRQAVGPFRGRRRSGSQPRLAPRRSRPVVGGGGDLLEALRRRRKARPIRRGGRSSSRSSPSGPARPRELEEKLRERARGNRRSIGPILALAELARVTNNEDKRRELLLEARAPATEGHRSAAANRRRWRNSPAIRSG